ncbi:MAG: LysR family transcriptional regulator [Spirochaetales bacterium]|nr:LysR family transcriptional regulator [Spirochaetales bacterium]
MDFTVIRKRSEYITLIKSFFIENGYLEVDTPILTPSVIPENSIELFETKYINPIDSIEKIYFLIPSPEIWMKKLLAEGSGNIFQVSKSFRNGEQTNRHHNPEFTMLEWYTVNSDYIDSIDITEKLIRYILLKKNKKLLLTFGNTLIDFSPPFKRLSMKEAFKLYAGINLDILTDFAEGDKNINTVLRENKFDISSRHIESLSWETKFNILFLALVEPLLPKERPVILFDYPAKIPTLAQISRDPKYSERWELYLAGMETANCYTEERNPDTILSFFRNEEQKGKSRYPKRLTDWNFPSIFKNNFPKCSGVALGIDRLLMVLLNKETIDGVFPQLFFK